MNEEKRLKLIGLKHKLSDLLLNTTHEELIEAVSIHLEVLETITKRDE